VCPRGVLRAFRGLAEAPGALARLVSAPARPLDPASHASPTPAPLRNHPQGKWLTAVWVLKQDALLVG